MYNGIRNVSTTNVAESSAFRESAAIEAPRGHVWDSSRQIWIGLGLGGTAEGYGSPNLWDLL